MSFPGFLYYYLKNKHYSFKEKKRVRNVINQFIEFSLKNDFEYKEEIVNFLSGNDAHPFPFDFVKKYQNKVANIVFEKNIKLFKVEHANNFICFPDDMNIKSVNRLYWGLVCEQDPESPHCYTQNGFEIDQNTVLVDIGCAEAMFSLNNINACEELILVESDPKWHKSINSTFNSYKNKVNIFYEIAGENKNALFLNKILELSNKYQNFFFKIDVEGNEIKVLESLTTIFERIQNIKISIATYHNQNDFMYISDWLNKHGFESKPTDKNILNYFDKELSKPYLRNCLIQATKKLIK